MIMKRSADQTLPPHANPHKINHPSIPWRSPFPQNLPSKFQETGILHTPPPFISHSYPPFSLRPPPQPPLLPLPTAARCGLSFPPTNFNNRTKRPNYSRKEKQISPPECVIIEKALPLIPPGNVRKKIDNNISNDFSGSVVFAISPPPSSLPLPRFSLTSKLCCKVEAASGIDTGATDDLRRLLRLR